MRASRADVRGGPTSEAGPESPVESGEDGSEGPRIPMWGMGGATAVRLIATAARRACTGAASTAQPLPHVPGYGIFPLPVSAIVPAKLRGLQDGGQACVLVE